MSVWVTNPFERFGKYFETESRTHRKRCGCTLERVKDQNYRAEIVQLITRNKARQYGILWCQQTFSYGGRRKYVHDLCGPIAHERLTENERHDARVIRENDTRKYPPCERCNSTDAIECHHWAPWKLFRDAGNWPQSNLCVEHHQLWHRVINRREIIGRPEHFLEPGDGPCERCKREVNVFIHHWAPKQLFVDWNEWPVSNLCFDCIVRWRSVMKNERDVIDPQVVAIAQEQCLIDVEEEDYYTVKYKELDAWLTAIAADLEEQMCANK